MRFIQDSTVKFPVFKNSGKVTEIRVGSGLPKDSRPSSKTIFETRKASHTQKGARTQGSPKSSTPGRYSQSSRPNQPVFNPPPPSGGNLYKAAASSSPNLRQENSGGSRSNLQGSNSHTSVASLAKAMQGQNISNSNLTSTGSLAAAAAKKRPPPPVPPAKKVPRCKALYVNGFNTRITKQLKLMN